MRVQSATRRHHDSVSADAKPLSVGLQGVNDIASLVETYLAAERHLVAAVELAGGAVALASSHGGGVMLAPTPRAVTGRSPERLFRAKAGW